MENQVKLETGLSKPVRSNSTFPFKDIPAGGGLYVSLSEGETLEKVAMSVRNAVASFKKLNKDFNLSTSVLEEEKQVLVYRDAVTEGE